MSSACWLDLAEAARRAGKSRDHVARMCRDKWQARGLARLQDGGGKKPRWQVREDADPSLARVKFPEQIGTDLRQVTESKRREAIARKKILDDWHTAVQGGFALGFNSTQITAQFLSHLEADSGRSVSQATLYNWEKRWRSRGLVGLVDSRGSALSTQHSALSDDPFFQEVRRLYLTPRKLKLTVCHEIATLKAAEAGIEAKSYKSCQRYIDSLPKAVVLKMRFGEDAFVNEAEPFIERDYSTLASNEIWVGDHHQFDVIVVAKGKHCRPWLTAWMDMRSRKIVGHSVFAHDPNSDTILRALDIGIRSHGVPTSVTIDNGKDYDSFALNGRTKKDRWLKRAGKIQVDREHAEGIFAALGITASFCWAYHGQSKPIERFFGTLEQATPVWATYCGRSTGEKPEDLQLQMERGNAPTLESFAQWFDAWLDKYHQTGHSGDAMNGKTPASVYETCLSTKRTAPAELLDVLLLRPTKPVKVTQNGVTYKGLRYGQHDLIEQLGQEVILRVDDADLSSVQVWSLDGKFIALAASNQKIPANASQQELREAIQAKRQARKTLADYRQARPRLADDLPDLLVRAKALRCSYGAEGAGPGPSGPGSDPPPPVLQPVRSPLEGEIDKVRAAIEVPLRKAVGDGCESRFVYRPASQTEGESGRGGEGETPMRFFYGGNGGGDVH